MRRYEAILFDVGVTLLDYRPDDRYGEWAKILGATPDAVAAALRDAVCDHPPLSGNEAREAYESAWTKIYSRTAEAIGFTGDRQAAVGAMLDVRVRLGWSPYPEVHDVLDELRARAYKLGVVSNWTVTLEETLAHLGLARHFEVVACSSVVGTTKPDPRIFRHALKALGVEPARTLYVGDHYEADVLGARAVGMDALLIQRDGVTSEHDDDGLTTIRSLLELGKLLEPRIA